ncbi:MAG: phosphomannomutase/phosphoglucomutase [Gammaproteobacteria bacterium]|nr:phosphomannomutase/phosphoglucomutase [Gammaproteobacteria bacterium]
MTQLDPAIFRTYDIRGIVDQDITEENIYWIGKALGSLVREQSDDSIIIARDGRLSSPTLSTALSDGILSTGCHVIDLGRTPTPLLYYGAYVLDSLTTANSTKKYSGVMLTGSHNPANYNGLKIVIQGQTLAEEGIKNLYQRIVEKNFQTGEGKRQTYDITQHYIHHITNHVQLTRPLKIVVDAGNGVAGDIAPALFRALGCEVIELYCDIDGRFPHHHPDPSQPENLLDLIHSVKENQADIGLAFDGDGDRLGVVTQKGDMIYPDRLLMLFTKMILAKHQQAKIIFDVKCTNHLPALIQSLGGQPIMWKTGHSLIKAKMAETQALLAGEMSGHFFFKDRWYGFDDALYAGARLLEIIANQDQSSDELFSTIPNSVNTPELKVLVAEEEKFSLMEKLIAQAHFKEAEDVMTIDGLRVNFSHGWGLVRPSNTTPCLVLRFEAINEIILNDIKTSFRQWMLSVKPDLVLPF